MALYKTYTTPTKNFFSALNTFRRALAYGENVRLMLVRNEDCTYPIQKRVHTPDEYTSSHGALYTENEIRGGQYGKDPLDLDLTLNYYPLFGKKEAAEHYYKTGELSEDNFGGVGYCHLVKRADIHAYLTAKGEPERAAMFLLPTDPDKSCWIYPAKRRDNAYWEPVQFKHKVWAVVLVDKGVTPNYQRWVKIFNVLAYPLKFIPRRRILRMKEYTNYTFSVGSVTGGYSVEFQIPKKFTFKD
jgi:hypothetical protein